MPALVPSAPSIPDGAFRSVDLRARDTFPARVPAVASDPVTGRLWERKASGRSTDLPRGFPSVEVERVPWLHTPTSLSLPLPPLSGKGLPKPRLFLLSEPPRTTSLPGKLPASLRPGPPLVLVCQPSLPTLGTTAAVPAPIQAPPVILTLPGQSVDRLCVDIKHSQGPMHLLSDPEQGERGTSRHPPREAQTPLPPDVLPQRHGWETRLWRHTHPAPCRPVPDPGTVTPLSTPTQVWVAWALQDGEMWTCPPGPAILRGWGDRFGHRRAPWPWVSAQSDMEANPEEGTGAVGNAGVEGQGWLHGVIKE